jgi:hypothetical protein
MRFMKIVEALLKELAENESFVSDSKNSLKGTWHNFLHKNTVAGNSAKDLALAWKTFEYWMDEKHKVSTSSLGARYKNKFSIQCINLKIIFFSNLKTIYRIIEDMKKDKLISTNF